MAKHRKAVKAENGGGTKPAAISFTYTPSPALAQFPKRVLIDGEVFAIGCDVTTVSGKKVKEATQKQYAKCFKAGYLGIRCEEK